jgi:DNA repair protein RadD
MPPAVPFLSFWRVIVMQHDRSIFFFTKTCEAMDRFTSGVDAFVKKVHALKPADVVLERTEMLTLKRTSLRAYQSKAVSNILEQLQSGAHTLLVSPTGAGKTLIAAEVAEQYDCSLMIAHRRELLEQADGVMGRGVHVMSLHNALRWNGKPQLLIIDEAHRAAAKTYRSIINRFPDALRLGLTATPKRLDGQGLIDAFDAMVEAASISELIAQGHLVPYRAFEAPDEKLKELEGMRKRGGDYDTGQLSKLMNRPRLVGDVVREYKKNANDRKAIAFAVSVDHSLALMKAFNDAGVKAAHLDGRASDGTRAEILESLRSGDINVLCNVSLFTEGWDCPAVSCVIMARPTASETLYLQCVGRGMRADDDKSDLMIMDHAGNIERHGPPDMLRNWSLESLAQRNAREAEIAELQRLHALGFESIEAELEEKQRFKKETYSAAEVDQKLSSHIGARPSAISSYLKRFSIRPVVVNGQDVRYGRREIDEHLELLATTYSFDQCKKICSGIGIKATGAFLKSCGIRPLLGSAASIRYPKALLDKTAQAWAATYSAGDAMRLFGLTAERFRRRCRRAGITPVISRGHVSRYDKLAIDEQLAKWRLEYSLIETRAVLEASVGRRIPSIHLFLNQYGIMASDDYGSSGRRYCREDIDSLGATLRRSASCQ